MLERSKEGKICLEDTDGSVELDFSKLVSGQVDPLLSVPVSLRVFVGRARRGTVY